MVSKEEWLAKLHTLEVAMQCHLKECRHWDLQMAESQEEQNTNPQFPDKKFKVCPNCGQVVYI